jgi:hypothetical protein
VKRIERPSPGLMARLGVPVGGRVRKLHAVEKQSAPIPEEIMSKLGRTQGRGLSCYEQAAKTAFVILMSADPEPCHSITVKDAKCTIAQRYSNRPYLFFLIHTLEV